MSRNVLEKVAKGEALDDDDFKYAVDRGIALPEEYEQNVTDYTQKMSFGSPGYPVVAGGTGPAASSSGPGLFLNPEELESLTVDTLHALADVKGQELSGRKKADLVAQLVGTAVSEEAEEDEAEEG